MHRRRVIPNHRELVELFLVPAAICVPSRAPSAELPEVHVNHLLRRVLDQHDGAEASLVDLLSNALVSGNRSHVSLPIAAGILTLQVDEFGIGGQPAILARCRISASAVQAIVADMFEGDPQLPSGATVAQYRLLRRALQLAKVGFIRDDPEAGTWEASDTIWEMMGLRRTGTPADSDFRSVMASLGDETFVDLASRLRTELSNETHRRFHEFKITRPDNGEQRRFAAEFHRVTEDGRIKIWAILRDVTDQAKALRELSAREALLQSAERIGRLGHWRLDIPNQTLNVSGNLHLLIDGQTSAPMNLAKEDVLAAFEGCIDFDTLRQRVSEQIETGPRWSLDHRIRRKSDGAERWLRQMGEAIFDEEGRLLVLRGAEQDITERVEASIERDRFRQALEQVQRAEAIEHLTGRLAHEVSNMLQPAFSFAGLAAAALERGAAEEAAAFLGKTMEAMARVDKLVKDDLALTGSRSESLEVVTIGEFVASLDRFITPQMSARVSVNFHGAASECRVRISRIGAAQIFLNILQNALDAAGEDAPVNVFFFISDDACDTVETLVADFIDCGPGFTEEALQQAFVPLFTTKPKGKGTGLGLPVVRSLIERWGGGVEISNLPGQGARVRLKLPTVCPGRPG